MLPRAPNARAKNLEVFVHKHAVIHMIDSLLVCNASNRNRCTSFVLAESVKFRPPHPTSLGNFGPSVGLVHKQLSVSCVREFFRSRSFILVVWNFVSRVVLPWTVGRGSCGTGGNDQSSQDDCRGYRDAYCGDSCSGYKGVCLSARNRDSAKSEHAFSSATVRAGFCCLSN